MSLDGWKKRAAGIFSFLAANKLFLIVTLIVYGLGSFVFFRFRFDGIMTWKMIDIYGLTDPIVSQGNWLFLSQGFIERFGVESFRNASVAVIYVILSLAFFAGQFYFVRNRKQPFFLLLSTVALALLFFHPLNGVSLLATAHLYLSAFAVAIVFLFAWFLRGKQKVHPVFWIVPPALAIVAFGLLFSTFSLVFAIVLLAWAICVVITEKKWLTPLNLVAAVAIVSTVVMFALSWSKTGGTLFAHLGLSFTEYLRNVVTMFAPSAFGSMSSWENPSDPAMPPYGKLLHIFSGLFAAVLLLAVGFLLVQAVLRKNIHKRLYCFLLVGFAVFGLIHAVFVYTPFAYFYDGAASIVAVPLLLLVLYSFPFHEKVGRVEHRFPMVSLYVKSIVLCVVVAASSIGSYGTAAIGRYNTAKFPSYLSSLYYSGTPEDIEVDERGLSFLALNQGETWDYVQYVRKNSLDIFADGEISTNFRSTDYCQGLSSGGTGKSERYDGWSSRDLRMLLNAGEYERFFFRWYIPSPWVGETMSVFVDGELLATEECSSEGFHSVTLDGFNPGENYFFKFTYPKVVDTKPDKRELGFMITEIRFVEGAFNG